MRMRFREILAKAMENRGNLSNPFLAELLRDESWTPDKDSLWRAILGAMEDASTLQVPQNVIPLREEG